MSPWPIWLYGVPAVALLVGLLHVLGYGPFRSFTETSDEEAELEQQVEMLKDENADLQGEIDALMPGQFGIEKRAREQLGWSKPGEIVIHLPEKK